MKNTPFLSHLPLLFLLLVGSVFLFGNLGNYYLWPDEGETALYGKRILQFGLPIGFDGRNLYEFNNGQHLNRDLLPTLTPWLQFYVAALSMKMFGFSNSGLRALFSVLGLATLVMQFLFVSRFFKNQRLGYIALALTVTSVSFILFSRSCRYYAPEMFLTSTLCYLYSVFQERKSDYCLIALLFFLLFVSHSLSSIAFCLAFFFSFFILENQGKVVKFFFIPSLIAAPFLGIFLSRLYQNGGITDPKFLRNLYPADFLRIIWLHFQDYNFTQLLPVGVLIGLGFFWYREGRFNDNESLLRVRGELAILAVVLLFTTFLSILSPQSSRADNSDIRYATAIFPLLLLLQAFVVEKVYVRQKWAGGVLLAILVGTNLLTFTPSRSFLYEYAQENLMPFDNPVKVAVQFLESRVGTDDIVLVAPNYMLGCMEYYLGDKVFFSNVIGEDNKNLLAAGVKIPRYAYSIDIVPDWIVRFGDEVDLPHTRTHLKNIPSAQYITHVFPILGHDRSRPELFWRTFVPITKFQTGKGLVVLERLRHSKNGFSDSR